MIVPKTIEELEKEIESLKVKIETLVDFLNARGQFGPPNGRQDYDRMVNLEVAKKGLL
jgi:hypothetical protein